VPRRQRGLKRYRDSVARPDSGCPALRAAPRQRLALAARRPRAPPSAPPRADRLARAARLPTAASLTAPSPEPPPCCPDRLARRSPVPVTPRRRLRAGEPSFPAVSCVPAPCHRRLAEQRRRALRRVRRPGRGRAGPALRTRAAHAAPTEALGCASARAMPRVAAAAPRSMHLCRARIRPSAPG
jgi:hypothetical protein